MKRSLLCLIIVVPLMMTGQRHVHVVPPYVTGTEHTGGPVIYSSHVALPGNTVDRFVVPSPFTADNTLNTDTLVVVLDKPYFVLSDVYIDGTEVLYYLDEFQFNSQNTATIEIPHDTYNIVAVLHSGPPLISIPIIEGLEFNGPDTVFLADTMAVHDLVIDPRSIDNQPLSSLPGSLRTIFSFVFELEEGNALMNYSWFADDYRISDYTGQFRMYWGTMLSEEVSGNEQYLIEYNTHDSILSNHYYTNDPAELAHIELDMGIKPDARNSFLGIGWYQKFITAFGYYDVWGGIAFYVIPNEKWTGSLYFEMLDDTVFSFTAQYITEYDYNSMEYYDSTITEFVDAYNDSLAFFRYFRPDVDVHLWNDNDQYAVNQGPQTCWMRWTNSSATIVAQGNRYDMGRSYLKGDNDFTTYIIFDDGGSIVATGAGTNVSGIYVDEGEYTVEQTNAGCYFGNGYYGKSILRAGFNTALDDVRPPPMRPMKLCDGDNNMKFRYEPGEEVWVHFTASDFRGYDFFYKGINYQPLDNEKTRVFVREHHSVEWISVPVTLVDVDSTIGSMFKARVSDHFTSDSAYFDLKITVVDTSDNYSEYEYIPALMYGNFPVTTPEHPVSENNIKLLPNPVSDKLSIVIPEGTATEMTARVYTIDGKLVREFRIDCKERQYSVNVSDLESGVYFLVMDNFQGKPVSRKFIKH